MRLIRLLQKLKVIAMRLCDVLSKPVKAEYDQVEGFLVNKSGRLGQKVDLAVGTVGLNYFCQNCEDMRTFYSKGNLSCIFVNKSLISIDCVLSCACGATVQAWFLIECNGDITSASPEIRILKKTEKLSDGVKINSGSKYGQFEALLAKADRAYQERLGAGAIIYLRKAYEQIAVQAADAAGIDRNDPSGHRKKFKTLLKEVDNKWNIIPRQFSENRYTLFEELSNVIHGDYDEDMALHKYASLKRLIIGVLDNVVSNEELAQEIENLGWNEDRGESA